MIIKVVQVEPINLMAQTKIIVKQPIKKTLILRVENTNQTLLRK